MFGYACTRQRRPAADADLAGAPPLDAPAQVRRTGLVGYLQPDGKTQVTIAYEAGRPVGGRHRRSSRPSTTTGIDWTTIHDDVLEHVIRPILPGGPRRERDERLRQPLGQVRPGRPARRRRAHGAQDHRRLLRRHGPPRRRRVLGQGPLQGRPVRGLRGALGGQARRGRGAAERCEVQVAYAIGVARPVSVLVETFGTERVDRAKIAKAVDAIFDLRPAAIIRDLDLRRPIYLRTAAYGHFGAVRPRLHLGADAPARRPAPRALALAVARGPRGPRPRSARSTAPSTTSTGPTRPYGVGDRVRVELNHRSVRGWVVARGTSRAPRRRSRAGSATGRRPRSSTWRGGRRAGGTSPRVAVPRRGVAGARRGRAARRPRARPRAVRRRRSRRHRGR